jgi:hypothetical protein
MKYIENNEDSNQKSLLIVTGRAKIIVPIDIVAPPVGHRDLRTTGTENRKRQDEEDRKTGSIPSSGDQVHVVLEDARFPIPKVELAEEPGENLAEDDASLGLVVWNITGELNKLGHVDL